MSRARSRCASSTTGPVCLDTDPQLGLAPPLLRLHGVGRRFASGTEALRDVSLDLAAGDFVALLGPSGCGKSTLLRLIAGLDQPDTGRLDWSGGAPPGPGEIGMVFQDATLMPWATAEANAALPLVLRGMPDSRARAEARPALARVGLAGFEGARPSALSGGMRMRVSLARALITRPRLLLMDEPFAALDEFTRHRLQSDLLTLSREAGCTFVFVTHSIYEAAFVAHRIVLMTPRPGRIASVIESDVHDDVEDRRLDPAYAALVARITREMRAALGDP
jgi:NitT/TauT family transport system ATP-binding protein